MAGKCLFASMVCKTTKLERKHIESYAERLKMTKKLEKSREKANYLLLFFLESGTTEYVFVNMTG